MSVARATVRGLGRWWSFGVRPGGVGSRDPRAGVAVSPRPQSWGRMWLSDELAHEIGMSAARSIEIGAEPPRGYPGSPLGCPLGH